MASTDTSVKCVAQFRDAQEGVWRNVGDKFTCAPSRAKELATLGFVSIETAPARTTRKKSGD